MTLTDFEYDEVQLRKLIVMRTAEHFARLALEAATEANSLPWWNRRRAWRLVGESHAYIAASECLMLLAESI